MERLLRGISVQACRLEETDSVSDCRKTLKGAEMIGGSCHFSWNFPSTSTESWPQPSAFANIRERFVQRRKTDQLQSGSVSSAERDMKRKKKCFCAFSHVDIHMHTMYMRSRSVCAAVETLSGKSEAQPLGVKTLSYQRYDIRQDGGWLGLALPLYVTLQTDGVSFLLPALCL